MTMLDYSFKADLKDVLDRLANAWHDKYRKKLTDTFRSINSTIQVNEFIQWRDEQVEDYIGIQNENSN